MADIVNNLVAWSVGIVNSFGYGGIFLTMLLESAAIPIPSEVIVPLGGFNASMNSMNFWLVAIISTVANVAGSAILYWLGFFGGRSLIMRYGKYVLIHEDDVKMVDGWIARHEASAAFFSRLIPGSRTFSSVMFGASRARFSVFVWLTAAGSFLWNLPLTYAGLVLGKNWTVLRGYFEKFEMVIIFLILILALAFILRHSKKFKRRL